jgi:hypothetical protein
MRQQNTSGSGNGQSLEVERDHHWQRKGTIATGTETRHNGDNRDRHRDSSSTWIIVLLVLFRYVLVNPLSATPLFSPSSLARAALFGLVVYMPRGRTVAPAQNSPQGAC